MKWQKRQKPKPVEEMTEAEFRKTVSDLRTSVELLWALVAGAFFWWLFLFL
jgi:hypothetical protein